MSHAEKSIVLCLSPWGKIKWTAPNQSANRFSGTNRYRHKFLLVRTRTELKRNQSVFNPARAGIFFYLTPWLQLHKTPLKQSLNLLSVELHHREALSHQRGPNFPQHTCQTAAIVSIHFVVNMLDWIQISSKCPSINYFDLHFSYVTKQMHILPFLAVI